MKTFTINGSEFQLVQDIQTEPYKVKRFLVKKKNNDTLVSKLCDLIIKFLLIKLLELKYLLENTNVPTSDDTPYQGNSNSITETQLDNAILELIDYINNEILDSDNSNKIKVLNQIRNKQQLIPKDSGKITIENIKNLMISIKKKYEVSKIFSNSDPENLKKVNKIIKSLDDLIKLFTVSEQQSPTNTTIVLKFFIEKYNEIYGAQFTENLLQIDSSAAYNTDTIFGTTLDATRDANVKVIRSTIIILGLTAALLATGVSSVSFLKSHIKDLFYKSNTKDVDKIYENMQKYWEAIQTTAKALDNSAEEFEVREKELKKYTLLYSELQEKKKYSLKDLNQLEMLFHTMQNDMILFLILDAHYSRYNADYKQILSGRGLYFYRKVNGNWLLKEVTTLSQNKL